MFLRLHTVMESDKICVLEKGRLVEEGSPEVFKFSLLLMLEHVYMCYYYIRYDTFQINIDHFRTF